MRRLEAAVGFRVHTGWATSVALAGTASAPQVVDRRRFTLTEASDHDSRFVYHVAADLDARAAHHNLTAARDIAAALALRELARLLSDLAVAGYSVRAVGMAPAASAPLPPLEAVLRSHPLIHKAESELFQSALADACRQKGLPVIGLGSKELHLRAARANGLRPESMKRRVGELGRALGPPWAMDQKEAALAALVARAERPAASSVNLK